MKKLFYILFFAVLLQATSAQVAVMVDTQNIKTSLLYSPEISIAASTGANSRAVPANTFTTVEISEKNYTPEILVSDADRVVYSNLNSLIKDPQSDYLHLKTKTLFPFNLGQFERMQIISFPNNPGKLSVIYKDKNTKSSIVLSLTPTHDAKDGRLRNEYLKEIKKLSKEEEKLFLPKPQMLKFKGRNYVNNGVSGTYSHNKSFAQYAVYECGVWLLGMKVKMQETDSLTFSKLTEELTQQFNPAQFTALSPLNLKSNVEFNREALNDTVMTSALVSSAFMKMNWAAENVSSCERHSGFPDVYLAMHIAALDEYLKIQGRKKSLSKSTQASEFYHDIFAIRNAGFLAEYIMEQYENVMIVPVYLKLDFDAYRRWKQGRSIRTQLTNKHYTITYRNLPY